METAVTVGGLLGFLAILAGIVGVLGICVWILSIIANGYKH